MCKLKYVYSCVMSSVKTFTLNQIVSYTLNHVHATVELNATAYLILKHIKQIHDKQIEQNFFNHFRIFFLSLVSNHVSKSGNVFGWCWFLSTTKNFVMVGSSFFWQLLVVSVVYGTTKKTGEKSLLGKPERYKFVAHWCMCILVWILNKYMLYWNL